MYKQSPSWDFPTGEGEPRHLNPNDPVAIRELRQDLHDLLPTPDDARDCISPPLEKWGSNIANPSHSRHHSLLRDSNAANSKEPADNKKKRRGHKKSIVSDSKPKGVRFGEAHFVTLGPVEKSSDPNPFLLHALLDRSNPIQCDFMSNPALLLKGSGEAKSRLYEIALNAAVQPTRIHQLTLVFPKSDWEIIVSTPATPSPKESHSYAVAECITVIDVLECVYMYLSEPVREHSPGWTSASSMEQDAVRYSLAKRKGKTLRRIDWLEGNTMFGGLEYIGGAARMDGGRWMVLFRRGLLLNAGTRKKR